MRSSAYSILSLPHKYKKDSSATLGMTIQKSDVS